MRSLAAAVQACPLAHRALQKFLPSGQTRCWHLGQSVAIPSRIAIHIWVSQQNPPKRAATSSLTEETHSGYLQGNVGSWGSRTVCCCTVCLRNGRGILNTAKKNLATRDSRTWRAGVCCWDGRVILNEPAKKGRFGGDFARTSPSRIAVYWYPPSSSYFSPPKLSSAPLTRSFAKGNYSRLWGTHARFLPLGESEGTTCIVATWSARPEGIGKAGWRDGCEGVGYEGDRGCEVLPRLGTCGAEACPGLMTR